MFGREPASIDAQFSGMQRTLLEPDAWFDYAPGWLKGHESVFEALVHASRALTLGWGDLLVMGGSCQRTWQHSVPKVQHAMPRIAIMFRPVWQEDGG